MATKITVKGATPVNTTIQNNIFDISAFKANISNSYHRTSSFQLFLSTPNGLITAVNQETNSNAGFLQQTSKLVFDIERLNMPGISLATDEIRRYGIGFFQRKPYVPTFETLDIIVRSDGGGLNYDFFQSWMKLVINYGEPPTSSDPTALGTNAPGGLGGSGKTSPYEVNYKKDYAVVCIVTAYNEEGKPAIAVTLRDAFPVYLGDMQYDWNETNTIVKFPVRLTFSDWAQDKNFVTTQSPSSTSSTSSQGGGFPTNARTSQTNGL